MNIIPEIHAQASQESIGTTASVKVYLLGLAIALASGGQAVLLMIEPNTSADGNMQVIACVMLVTGSLLFGVSTLKHRFEFAKLELPSQDAVTSQFTWPDLWSCLWILITTCLALATIYIFSTRGESPLTVFLWLFSILALFVSQFQAGRLALTRIRRAERFYWVGLALLLVITLVTRVYHLTTLPYNLDGDFASVGLVARALATGQQQKIFAFGWASIPYLGYLPVWLSMKLFGTGLAGLNASGVMEGLLMIIGVYLLGRDLFQARVGLLAAALLTVSYTHLAASRQSVYIDPVVFILFAIYFLLTGLRLKRKWAVIVSGVLTAFCLLLYYSGRIIFPLMAIFLLFLLIFHRRWLSSHLGLILLWILAILLTLGPMILVFMRNPDALITRTRDVFIFTPKIINRTQELFQVNTIPAMLLEQARRTVLLFHYFQDKGTQFALQLPFLDPLTATLFTLGLGYALCHWRRLGSWLLLSWIALGVVIGCFLTADAPFWPRLIILLPPSALLAGIALNLLYELLHRIFVGIKSHIAYAALLVVLFLLVGCVLTVNAPLWLRLLILLPPSALLAVIALNMLYEPFHRSCIGINGRLAPAASLAVLLMLIGLGWQNWNLYVLMKSSNATPRTFIARYLADQPLSTQAHLVSTYFGYKDREFEFLAPGHLVDNLTPEEVERANLPQGSTKMLILSSEQQGVVEQLQKLYPGLMVETHKGNTPSEIAFYIVRLP